MDESAPPSNPSPDFNKLDLSQLQSFSFGTQWTQDKSAPREARRDDRPRRDDTGGPDRRDRRAFRRPAGPGDGAGAPAGAPASPEAPRREFREGDNRGPRRDSAPFRGGPRRDGDGGGRDDRQGAYRGAPVDRGPYDSPYFHTTFYPEDTSFTTLAKTIRASCRTFELFDIARTVIGKPDRFVVVLHRKSPGDGAPSSEGAGKPAPIALSVPDGLPFESEEAAVSHVLAKHFGEFFDIAEVEVEPPKGNFQVVNKCGITGELLAPPNYHRYSAIIQLHHAKYVDRMSFEAFRARIETIRDPEVIAKWLEKMKKTTRYTWKTGKLAAPAAAPAPAPVDEAPVAEVAPVETPVEMPVETPAEAAPAPAAAAPAEPVLSFDSYEEARTHLLTNARQRVVRLVDGARLQGKVAETLPPGEVRRAIEGTLERQRRFPLDTANALRGRLRREGFSIYKKGSKGASYVCAVRRKFRVPDQVFSDSITGLIQYIETHPLVKAGELAEKFLGFPAAPKAPAEGTPAAAVPELSPADREKLNRLQGDLRWLVHEGYVTEFITGSLFAPPPMVEARKKEIEASENDPENFPEAPESATPFPAAKAESPAEAAPAPVVEPAPESVAPAANEPSEPLPPTGV
ncbi:MAG: hypothetical protein RL324_565 [Verrucomicrobiota bacterium]|jgi:hypothetical protein